MRLTGSTAVWAGSSHSAETKVSGFTEPALFFLLLLFFPMPIGSEVWEGGRLRAVRSPSHASVQLVVFKTFARITSRRNVSGRLFQYESPVPAPTPSIFHPFGGGVEVCGYGMMLMPTEMKKRDFMKLHRNTYLNCFFFKRLMPFTHFASQFECELALVGYHDVSFSL